MMMTIDTTTEDIKPLAFPVKVQPFFRGIMPLPPSVDAAYKVGYIHRTKGDVHRIIPSAELEQFKRDAALMLTQAVGDWSLINAIRDSTRKVPLAVHLIVYFRQAWKSDLDNRAKFAIDAAFERIQLNDKLVTKITMESEIDPIEPRVEIDVRCVVR